MIEQMITLKEGDIIINKYAMYLVTGNHLGDNLSNDYVDIITVNRHKNMITNTFIPKERNISFYKERIANKEERKMFKKRFNILMLKKDTIKDFY